MEVSFYLSYTVLKGNSDISRNKGTSVWNFVPNSGLTVYRILPQHSDRGNWYRLSSKEVDAQSVINWTVVDQQS